MMMIIWPLYRERKFGGNEKDYNCNIKVLVSFFGIYKTRTIKEVGFLCGKLQASEISSKI